MVQLQNKETKIKYSIVLDQDEMNDLIRMLEKFRVQYEPTSNQHIIIDSLKTFRDRENEPTERNMRFDDPNL